MSGPVLLRRYMETKQKTQADLSRELLISEGALSRYLRGQRQPSIDVAALIERATKGAVPSSAWASAESIAPEPRPEPKKKRTA